MTDQKQTEPKESCCNFEDMKEKMQEFCGGSTGSFNCEEMMKNCCGSGFEREKQ